MTRQQSSDKKEKSLAEIVIIIIMVAILMVTFIHYFFKQEDQITKVGFNTLSHHFSTKITTVHAQWLMDKKPNIVFVALSDTTQHIHVNQFGWVDVIDDTAACESIWQHVMLKPLMFMKQPIHVKKERVKDEPLAKKCIFSLPSGEYFEYNSKIGQVSRVKNINTSS